MQQQLLLGLCCRKLQHLRIIPALMNRNTKSLVQAVTSRFHRPLAPSLIDGHASVRRECTLCFIVPGAQKELADLHNYSLGTLKEWEM
eukprot:6213910-Pleurochrysis_carterae.AAC.3